MDEPTTGLDLGGREQVMRTLSRIGEEKLRACRGAGHPSSWRRFRQASITSPLWAASRFLPRMPPKRAWIQWVIPVLAPSSTPVRWRDGLTDERLVGTVRHAHRSPAHSRPLGRLRRVMPFWSPPAEAVGQADWGRCQQYFSFFGRFYFSLRPLWRGLSA